MSGGSFDHAYKKLDDFAGDLGLKIARNGKDKKFVGGLMYGYRPITIAKLSEIKEQAIRMAAIIREVEWLYSSDIDEDDFMARVVDGSVRGLGMDTPNRKEAEKR